MSALFSNYRLASLELRNRIVIAPMCQYSADEGRATDWHIIHLGNLSLSGAALLVIEATAVLPAGRISPDDLGLWSDETEEALGRVIRTIRRHSDMPIASSLRMQAARPRHACHGREERKSPRVGGAAGKRSRHREFRS
jgi:2,4-dienoyl-CoA reductase-like NADH-dependent reductase (Old Yellow Enzyme family)